MPIAAPYSFARGTPEASLSERLREALADARFALAEREAVAHLLAPEVDPTLLLGFMVEFAALSVQLQEPVEQFLVAASGRCEQLGERKAARELLRLAHDAIERYADYADDTRALTLRWNAAHEPELDLTGLLTQPKTRAMRRLFALHNQVVTSDDPWAELALICELESMTAAVAPLLVLHAERRLGADIRSGMRGVIGTAVVVGAISVMLIKHFKLRTLYGEQVRFEDKKFDKGMIYGGLIFGVGWAITGACPGPLFAQIGGGFSIVAVTLLSAIAGTWSYGALRDKLPH